MSKSKIDPPVDRKADRPEDCCKGKDEDRRDEQDGSYGKFDIAELLIGFC
jgi:hypothetical protein